jgi:hypothetical protein
MAIDWSRLGSGAAQLGGQIAELDPRNRGFAADMDRFTTGLKSFRDWRSLPKTGQQDGAFESGGPAPDSTRPPFGMPLPTFTAPQIGGSTQPFRGREGEGAQPPQGFRPRIPTPWGRGGEGVQPPPGFRGQPSPPFRGRGGMPQPIFTAPDISGGSSWAERGPSAPAPPAPPMPRRSLGGGQGFMTNSFGGG